MFTLSVSGGGSDGGGGYGCVGNGIGGGKCSCDGQSNTRHKDFFRLFGLLRHAQGTPPGF